MKRFALLAISALIAIGISSCNNNKKRTFVDDMRNKYLVAIDCPRDHYELPNYKGWVDSIVIYQVGDNKYEIEYNITKYNRIGSTFENKASCIHERDIYTQKSAVIDGIKSYRYTCVNDTNIFIGIYHDKDIYIKTKDGRLYLAMMHYSDYKNMYEDVIDQL